MSDEITPESGPSELEQYRAARVAEILAMQEAALIALSTPDPETPDE